MTDLPKVFQVSLTEDELDWLINASNLSTADTFRNEEAQEIGIQNRNKFILNLGARQMPMFLQGLNTKLAMLRGTHIVPSDHWKKPPEPSGGPGM